MSRPHQLDAVEITVGICSASANGSPEVIQEFVELTGTLSIASSLVDIVSRIISST
jgi:hypothetical protein